MAFSYTGGSVSATSYWDVESTGQSASPGGGTPIQTILELKTKLPKGFNPAVWGVYPPGVVLPYAYGAIYPFLKWQSFSDPSNPLDSTLGFPLHGFTPFTAAIVTVVDHSGTPLDPNKRHPWYYQDSHVTAYNGETGSMDFSKANCTPGPGYKNSTDTKFVINGNYQGATCKIHIDPDANAHPKKFLNYDGHPGFDYLPSADTTIYAPANGVLKTAKFDNVNHNCNCTEDGWDEWHSFYIMHGTGSSVADFKPNGWSTWYLHVDKTLLKPEGWVNKDDSIATVSNFGKCNGVRVKLGAHLHFEVRKGPIELVRKVCPPSDNITQDHVVDPYADAVWTAP